MPVKGADSRPAINMLIEEAAKAAATPFAEVGSRKAAARRL